MEESQVQKEMALFLLKRKRLNGLIRLINKTLEEYGGMNIKVDKYKEHTEKFKSNESMKFLKLIWEMIIATIWYNYI